MTANVGSLDRALRLFVGVALIVAPLINFMGLGTNAAVAYFLMGVGGILALTAVFGVCPIYRILGIKTKS
ncbi:MAG: YgaP family membrane protein [Yoonia sp.]|uniref:YgaP family membrane protein n=1 Tax=Yoonia sp. TaxID=2212373 RepID=UPI003EF80FBB